MSERKFKKIEYQHKGISWATYPEVCKACGLCIAKCPVQSLSFDDVNVGYLGLPVVKNDIEKCIACRVCEVSCPDSAIRVDGKK